MAFFVKWKMHGQDKVLGSTVPYAHTDAAMDFACTALRQKPADIWIEDEHGTRVGDELGIIRHGTKQVRVTTFRPPARPRTPMRRSGGGARD